MDERDVEAEVPQDLTVISRIAFSRWSSSDGRGARLSLNSFLGSHSTNQHLVHIAGQCCRRVRFGQELDSVVKHAVLRDNVIRVP